MRDRNRFPGVGIVQRTWDSSVECGNEAEQFNGDLSSKHGFNPRTVENVESVQKVKP